jgi:argininosuccinate synthase
LGSSEEIEGKEKEMKQRKLHEKTGAAVAPEAHMALDNVVKSMYGAAMKLQEIQTSFPTPISRAAILGMSADVSKMLMKFRKISSAIKSGDDKRIEKSIEEAKIRSLVAELIAEELKKR